MPSRFVLLKQNARAFQLKEKEGYFGLRFQPLMVLILLDCDSRKYQEHTVEQSEKQTEEEVVMVLIAPSRARHRDVTSSS